MRKMTHTKTLGLALVAVFAFGAFVAASASAVGGPVWIVLKGTELVVLGAGQSEALTSTGGTFALKGATEILCTAESDTGKIIGGNPGTDETSIQFSGCSVEGKTVAECGASNTATAGLVEVNGIKTVLVYPQGKAGSTTEALDAFIPGSGNLFVEFTLKGTNCGLLNNIKVNVNATGTEITEPAFNKKCGVLARVGKLNSSNAFVATISGEEALVGALNSEELLTEAELWLPTAKVFNLITCKLEAFSLEASELGVSDVTLVSKNEFGWEV